MKKLYKILIVAGVLLALMPVSSMADSIVDIDSPLSEIEEKNYVIKDEAKLRVKSKQQLKENYAKEASTDAKERVVKFRGIWGLSDDNESDGYFGGKIIRRQKVTVLKGLYNKTGNESKGKVVGIMKDGYFNGRVINPDGKVCKITGLFKINKDELTFGMHWLTPYNSGWTRSKLIPEE